MGRGRYVLFKTINLRISFQRSFHAQSYRSRCHFSLTAEVEERELLLPITTRTLGFYSGDLLTEFALGAGDGGFLKIRNSDSFFS